MANPKNTADLAELMFSDMKIDLDEKLKNLS